MQRNQAAARRQSIQHRQTTYHCDPVQMYQGKRRDGKQEFDNRIASACEQYEAAQVALIHKTQEPMRTIKRLEGGKFISAYGDKTEPGFKGTLYSGKTVVFEAVFTETDRIEKTQLTLQQEELMDAYDKLHAEVFVLIGFADGCCFRIPWWVWKGMKNIYRHKYIKANDVMSYSVDSGYVNGKLCFEFLRKSDWLGTTYSVADR